MQILQNVARRYGLVCLLHEKPFAGVNGSGKHNNWSMGTDTGVNLLEPGETPHENLQFLFFCTAVIQAVDDHQQLLRASVANAGQDHRLGANEAPPAIISVFLGAELEKIFDAIESGSGDAATPQSLPRARHLGAARALPMHGGDRNRTSPFAFTGNKFEFRALGSSMSLALPNTVLNTIVAQAIDDLADKLEAATDGGASLEEAILAVVKDDVDRPQARSSSRRQLLRGLARRGGVARPGQPAPRPRTRCRGSSSPRPSRCSRSTRCCPSASSSRATRSRSSSTRRRSTSRARRPRRSRARCCCPAAIKLARHARHGRVGTGVGAPDARSSSGLVDEFVEAIFALEAANDATTRTAEALDGRQVRPDRGHRGDGQRPRGRRQARERRPGRPLAAAEVLRGPLHQVATGRSEGLGPIPDGGPARPGHTVMSRSERITAAVTGGRASRPATAPRRVRLPDRARRQLALRVGRHEDRPSHGLPRQPVGSTARTSAPRRRSAVDPPRGDRAGARRRRAARAR